MINQIYFKGACEREHFIFLKEMGFSKFVINNDPSSASFTSMRVICDLITNEDIKDFIFTRVPSSVIEFNYYRDELNKHGVALKFCDDLTQSIECDSLNFDYQDNKGACSLIFNAEQFFNFSRELDFNSLELALK